METPLVDATLLLEKFPGKGGWTYAVVPNKLPVKRENFGWVKVKGTIDDYEISDYSLAPIKGGKLFLPVKGEIRKKIKKQAGDYVKVLLYPDDSVFEVPEEILACLEMDEQAKHHFTKLPSSKKREYVKWIYSAKQDDTRAARILKMMEQLTVTSLP